MTQRSLSIFVLHASDMLTDYLPNGEAWIAYNFLAGLARRGHTVHVAVPRIEVRSNVPEGLFLHRVPKGPGWSGRIAYMCAVRRLLSKLRKSVRFDIVQQLTPVETGLSLSVAGSRIPLVLGPLPPDWPAEAISARSLKSISKLKKLARSVLAWLQQSPARALIVPCPAALERIVSQRARRERAHIVGSGIHSQYYQTRPEVPKAPSILFLANLERWKGIYTLLEAFDRVAEQVPGCTLEIWGGGSEADRVAAIAARSPFSSRIHCHGPAARERVGEIMRGHSVYCLPSYGEPFATTLLEAMASGVPIVATDAGGSPYIVRESGGRLVPMRDSRRLADALTEILLDDNLQREMGTFNRQRAEQEFDWRTSLDRLERVYRHVLAEA